MSVAGQCTDSDGCAVDRARAWCEMIDTIYYRSVVLYTCCPLRSASQLWLVLISQIVRRAVHNIYTQAILQAFPVDSFAEDFVLLPFIFILLSLNCFETTADWAPSCLRRWCWMRWAMQSSWTWYGKPRCTCTRRGRASSRWQSCYWTTETTGKP